MFKKNPKKSVLSLTLLALLTLVLVLSSASLGFAQDGGLTATGDVTVDSTFTNDKTAAANRVEVGELEEVNIIITVDESIDAGTLKDTPSAYGQVTYEYDTVFNGLAISRVSGANLDAITSLTGVTGIYLDQEFELNTGVGPQWIGAPTVWNALGGQENAGEGVSLVFWTLVSGQKTPPSPIQTPHADGYPRLLESTFGADAAAVAQRYPLDRYGGSAAVAYSTAVTDGAFACVADRIGDALVADAPVYGYEFADPAPPTPDPLRQLPFPVGASHSLDLRYIFNMGGAPPPTPDQIALSDHMIGYWSSFVRDGRPGGEGAPEWPALAGDDHDSRMSLRPDGSRVITDYDQVHQCAFWAGLQH